MKHVAALIAVLVATHAYAQDTDLEGRALAALSKGEDAALASLSGEIAAVGSATAIRVRPKQVEFRFRGHYPNVALGGGPRTSFYPEYLVGPVGVREDELLLAVTPDELKRAVAFGRALLAWRSTPAARGRDVEVKLAWTDDGVPHVEDLRDILRTAPLRERSILSWLRVSERRGLGGGNTTADLSLLPRGSPKRRVPAMLVVTVPLS